MGRSAGTGTVKQQLQSAKGRPSAFELAPIARKRHNIVGARDRGSKGRSDVQARARSDQIRRETLLVEHQQRGRTNVFHDGRFAEDEDMPLEDKLVHRFQRERQRQLRSSKFSLDESSGVSGALGVPTELTHGGRSLGDMEDLSDADLGDSDGDNFGDSLGSSAFVRDAHFGGGEDDDARRPSGKDLLEETIAKYKLAKYERQEERSEQNKFLQQLDADFDSLRGLIFQAGNSKANKPAVSSLAAAAAVKGGASSGPIEAGGGEGALAVMRSGPAAHSDFEKLASELRGEMKAQPSDRMQTDEELAKAEAQRLKGLESERLRRMKPDGDDAVLGGPRRLTDDDLVDDFGPPSRDEAMDDDGEEGEEEEEEEEEDDDEGDEEEDDEGLGAGEEEGDDDDDDDDESASEGEGDEGGEGSTMERTKVGGRRDGAKAAAPASPPLGGGVSAPLAELPYVFECPTSGEELVALMDLAGPDATRQRELLHRLIAGHHSKLREENRGKLQTLVSLLVNHLVASADAMMPSPAAVTSSGAGGRGEPSTPLLHPLCPAIFAIAQQMPVQCALAVLPVLQRAWRSFTGARRRARGQSRNPNGPSHVSLPPGDLALLALCVQLFPLTDFRHAVLTPATLLMQDALSQSQTPTTAVGVRRTLFLCSCALQLVAAGGRWLPELLSTACMLLSAAFACGAEGKGTGAGTTLSAQPLRFDSLASEAGRVDDAGAAGTMEAAMRLDEASASYALMKDLISLSTEMAAFPEAFAPVLEILCAMPASQVLPALRPQHEELHSHLRTALQTAVGARMPLRLQRAPVVPLKQFNPAFDDDFQPDRLMDPDRERAEQRKLVRKTKKERRGAIRELRKDGLFLAAERAKEKGERDAYLEKRGKRALALMEEQEHMVKSMKKEKRKLGSK